METVNSERMVGSRSSAQQDFSDQSYNLDVSPIASLCSDLHHVLKKRRKSRMNHEKGRQDIFGRVIILSFFQAQ